MTRHNFAPFLHSAIGFDRLARLLESAPSWAVPETAYPPCNIERADQDSYRITLAVPGYELDDLSVEQHQDTLVVQGSRDTEQVGQAFLHRGFEAPPFRRTFQLADYVTVEGATLENGLLRIDLHRDVPEELKPRRIEIGSGPKKLIGKTKKLIEGAIKAA